jgi:hypothetical protein
MFTFLFKAIVYLPCTDFPLQNLYKQLLRASRQWRDMQSRMHSGLGHYDEEQPRDGSMAVFCPACPQPGINLPDDWKTRYTRYGVSPITVISLLIHQKQSTHSHIHHGWQLLSRTHEV